MMIRGLLLLIVAVTCAVAAAPIVDYEVVAASKGTTKITTKVLNVTGGGTEIHTQAYYAHVTGINKDTYTPATQPGGCTGERQPLSVSAQYNKCTYATNGAFFYYTAENHCQGSLLIDNKWEQYEGGTFPTFSQKESDLSWVVGYVDNSTIKSLGINNLITGNCWLVRNGENNVNKSHTVESDCSSAFIKLVAPRTSVGVGKDGSLLLLQVDGIEVTSGMDLYQFADLLVSVGAWNAINLDGGGSSTSWYEGKVFDNPHCDDTPTVCERSIASITCVRLH